MKPVTIKRKFRLGDHYTVICNKKIISADAVFFQSTQRGFNFLCQKKLRNLIRGGQHLYSQHATDGLNVGDYVDVMLIDGYNAIYHADKDHDKRVAELTCKQPDMLETHEKTHEKCDLTLEQVAEGLKSIDETIQRAKDEAAKAQRKLAAAEKEKQELESEWSKATEWEREEISNAIDRFARCMKGAMYSEIGKKKGWKQGTRTDELIKALCIKTSDIGRFAAPPLRCKYTLDVANYAMMVWLRTRILETL